MSFFHLSIFLSAVIGVLIIAWIRSFDIVYGTAFFEESGKMGFFNINNITERLKLLNDTMTARFRKKSLLSARLLQKIFD